MTYSLSLSLSPPPPHTLSLSLTHTGRTSVSRRNPLEPSFTARNWNVLGPQSPATGTTVTARNWDHKHMQLGPQSPATGTTISVRNWEVHTGAFASDYATHMVRSLCTCVYVCMYTCVYIYTYTYMWIRSTRARLHLMMPHTRCFICLNM